VLRPRSTAVDDRGELTVSARSQYLLGLYVAEHREGAPVSPGVVGEMTGRSSATVIETFREFEDEGLLTYEPYEGASRTGTGRRQAEELHETCVTLSWFFRSVLDLDEYETEAMEMAGLVSADVADDSPRHSRTKTTGRRGDAATRHARAGGHRSRRPFGNAGV
jgi:DtxR family Mn-dependent transcriptional regulator